MSGSKFKLKTRGKNIPIIVLRRCKQRRRFTKKAIFTNNKTIFTNNMIESINLLVCLAALQTKEKASQISRGTLMFHVFFNETLI